MRLIQVFGKELQHKRKEANLRQGARAALTRLDRTFISLLERCLRKPSLFTLFALSLALDLKRSEIVSRVEQKLKNKTLLLVKRKSY